MNDYYYWGNHICFAISNMHLSYSVTGNTKWLKALSYESVDWLRVLFDWKYWLIEGFVFESIERFVFIRIIKVSILLKDYFKVLAWKV